MTNIPHKLIAGCEGDGPSKYEFCVVARRFVGGWRSAGLPRVFAPGTSRFGNMLDMFEVGSCALISGERHSGGKTSGGGLGEGAKRTRFSPPSTILTGSAEAAAGASVFEPPAARRTFFRPVYAHRLPPPDWHPPDVELLKVLSSAWPIAMSPIDSMSERARRSESELSLVSVKEPSEPPLIVQVPGESGGISEAPFTATFGLFGKLLPPSCIGLSGSWVGLPVPP